MNKYRVSALVPVTLYVTACDIDKAVMAAYFLIRDGLSDNDIRITGSFQHLDVDLVLGQEENNG